LVLAGLPYRHTRNEKSRRDERGEKKSETRGKKKAKRKEKNKKHTGHLTQYSGLAIPPTVFFGHVIDVSS
jgi:hypothetical protein